jgi:hypothetical protein
MGSLLKSKYARASLARSAKSVSMRWLRPAAPNQSNRPGGQS